MHKFKYIFFLECILSTWQTLKAKNTHLRTAGVVQDSHNSLISAFLISQLDHLLTRYHSRSFKLGVGVARLAFLLMVQPQPLSDVAKPSFAQFAHCCIFIFGSLLRTGPWTFLWSKFIHN